MKANKNNSTTNIMKANKNNSTTNTSKAVNRKRGVKLGVYVTTEIKEMLIETAERKGVSQSDIIEYLITRYYYESNL